MQDTSPSSREYFKTQTQLIKKWLNEYTKRKENQEQSFFLSSQFSDWETEKKKKNTDVKRKKKAEISNILNTPKNLYYFLQTCFICVLKSEVNFVGIYDRMSSTDHFLSQISDFTWEHKQSSTQIWKSVVHVR